MGEDIVAKYSSQLADLKINSKPLINLLTMMAEDFLRHAPAIVQVIEKHLAIVRPEIKLPVLYLIDSIIKNVKKDYVTLFTQNIVSTFCGVFEKVDEKTRGLLWKLRGTWTDHFPQKKLYAIDLRCHEIDQKWPIQAQPPASGSIHVNPRFLKGKAQAALLNTDHILTQATTVTPAAVVVPPVMDTSASEVQMRAQLLAKQKELLELQTKKVELELLQTKLQIEEKARRQKEEEATKDIAIALQQEKLLLDMAETAKNRTAAATDLIQQQLLNLQPKAPSVNTSRNSPPSKSQSQESASDRESHSSLSSKLAKSHSEASGSSSVDGSPSKKKSSREKSDRDRSDRRDRSKSDKGRDRHESKEKESRHRHRDKPRHAENSKEKDKSREKSRERNRESSTKSKTSGGEWKDYNEAKLQCVSPGKRSYRKDTANDSEDEDVEMNHDVKPKPLKRLPSPTLDIDMKLIKQETGSPWESDSHNAHAHQQAKKSPSSTSSQVSESSTGGSSPLKRKLKEKACEKERSSSKDKDAKSERHSKEKEKPIISDPRLRRRMEKEKALLAVREQESGDTGDEPIKPSEWKDYRARQQAVLRRSYRKHTGIDLKDDMPTQESHDGVTVNNIKPEENAGDIDLRFEPPFNVDLRTETDGSGPEPPSKKSRPGSHSTFVDLFGPQDVDLRPGTSCWGQVKLKSEVDEGLLSQAGNNIDMDLSSVRDSKVMRSPGPPSPANSVVSSTSSACDPLGRPLIYNRLPNDPEERKRSLDSRSTSIDAVEQFRSQHIDRALRGAGGILSDNDMKMICLRAKEEHDQGSLNADQYVAVMKQIVQIGNASAMKEAQQMQMRGNSWQVSDNTPGPNPWVTANETENNIWSSFGAGSTASVTTDFSMRFAGNATPWDAPKTTPWITNPIPAPPTGPNPFEEAIARPPVIDDFVPKVNPKDLRFAEQDIGRTIPIDKVVRQIRFYRENAIVMMGIQGDEPRDLNFQMDDLPRTILINGKPLKLFLGETKKFDLNQVTHTLKLGTPGRELYIDDKRHELFFGGRPKHIFVDGRSHTFQLSPPSPQVAVGSVPRHDLCAGKVTLTVDAITHVSVFLDEKLQKIEIGGEVVVIRFCNGFKAVTLNGRQFPTNFGARLPFSVTLANSEKHFLRFNAVSPETELGMQTFINANYGGEWNDNRNFGGRGGRGIVRGNMRGGRGMSRGRGLRDNPIDARASGPNPWAQEGGSSSESASNQNPLDLLNSLFQTPAEANHKHNPLDHSYESEQAMVEEDAKEPESDKPVESGGNLNVGDLVANLIKFGLLPAAPAAENNVTEEPVEEKEEVAVKEEEKVEDSQEADEKKEESKEVAVKAKPTIPPLPTVDVSLDDNLKERRDVAIAQISTGVQCSQCGLRFPPDQTLRYSQHLDWHFRQNRREKANARKALSRKWYYDLSDWIQFEEIEDLEERAASLFENPDGDNENDAQSPGGTALNPEDFTVLSSAHNDAPVCPQCGETFESFFDEEREEWRLKNAKLDEYEGEAKLYHPICHQDYLRSLVEESVIEEENETEPLDTGSDNKENEDHAVVTPVPVENQEEEDEVLIIKEGKKEVVVMEIDIDDDDVEKHNSSVNVLVNEEDKSNDIVNIGSKTDDDVTVKENYNSEKECVKDIADDSSLDNTATRNSLVQSPILIDEDSTFLPGLCDETEGGVFGFALGSGSQTDRSTEQSEVDEKRIIYEPMKFDMPAIKLEPVDEQTIEEDAAMVPDDFIINLQRLASAGDKGPEDVEPMNIDLTEEDSTDAVDSGARLVTQIRTSIDGNLQHEDATALVFTPAPKIRINLTSAFGSLSVPSEKEKVAESPQVPNHSSENENTGSQEQGFVKDDGSSNNIVSNNAEINKSDPIDPVLTEEMKRLKPRLVGKKLTNYPPKFKGKEESGLCVIC